MKKHIIPLILISIIFLYENTSTYWKYKLGGWIFPITLIYYILFLCVLGFAIYYIVECIREKMKDRKRNIITFLIVLVVTLSFFIPGGLFSKRVFYKGNLLVAYLDGTAGNDDRLTLYGNGIYEYDYGRGYIEGKYRVDHDTIYFDSPRNENTYTFDYATLWNDKSRLSFGKDSITYSYMSIVKNELIK